MTEQHDEPQEPEEPENKKHLTDRLREHFLAAEVAAEAAAAYGPGTVAVEAVEAAIDPEHEVGAEDEDAAGGTEKPPQR